MVYFNGETPALSLGQKERIVMPRLIFLIACVLILFPATGMADVIYLKNGKAVQGVIYQEGKYSVKMRVGKKGIPKTFYRKEIDRVVREDKEKAAEEALLKKAMETISDSKRELIERLLDANGARESMQNVFTQIIQRAPEEGRDDVRALLRVDEVIEELIPVYAKYFTETDLRELIAFYKSPTGRKHLDSVPKIIEDTMKVTTKYFKDKVASLDKAP